MKKQDKQLIRKELKEAIDQRLVKYRDKVIDDISSYEEIKNEINEAITEIYIKYNIGFEIKINNINESNIGIVNYCDK